MLVEQLMRNLIPNYNVTRHFALCESCFWCASILKREDTIVCPLCNSSGNVSLIPLALDESFRVNFNVTSGLEISFSGVRKRTS